MNTKGWISFKKNLVSTIFMQLLTKKHNYKMLTTEDRIR